MAGGPCPQGHQLGTPLLTLLTFYLAMLSDPCVSGIRVCQEADVPAGPAVCPHLHPRGCRDGPGVPMALGCDVHPQLSLLLPVEVLVLALVPGTQLCRGDG